VSKTDTQSRALTQEQVECVVEAVSSVMEWAAGERPTMVGKEPLGSALRCEGIIGCISLVGDIDWSLVLSLPRPTATALAEGFAGFAVPFDGPDMGDAIGEVANLVAGETKVHLDGIGLHADISLPQVFRGDLIEVLQLPHVPSELLRFESACGPFWVAIAQGR